MLGSGEFSCHSIRRDILRFFVGARPSILTHIHISGRPMRPILHARLCGTAEIEPMITFLYNSPVRRAQD